MLYVRIIHKARVPGSALVHGVPLAAGLAKSHRACPEHLRPDPFGTSIVEPEVYRALGCAVRLEMLFLDPRVPALTPACPYLRRSRGLALRRCTTNPFSGRPHGIQAEVLPVRFSTI